jgi:hypothetical protein
VFCSQRLEGSRSGAHFVPLAIFVSSLVRPKRAETGGSRELPSAMLHPWLSIRLHPDPRAANRWVVPGSRLLRHFLAGCDAGTNIARSSVTCQSGSPPRRWEQTRLVNVPILSKARTACPPEAHALYRHPLKIGLAREARSRTRTLAKAEERFPKRLTPF